MSTFITTADGKAGVTIDGNTLGIVEKNQFGGTNQAYATLSRSELEQIRDAITAELERPAEPAPLHFAANVGQAGNEPYKTACGTAGNSTIYFRGVTCPACVAAIKATI